MSQGSVHLLSLIPDCKFVSTPPPPQIVTKKISKFQSQGDFFLQKGILQDTYWGQKTKLQSRINDNK